MKKNKASWLTLPYMVWMIVFTLIPLGVVAYYALTDPDTGAFTLSNLMDLSKFLPVLGRSVGYAVISALICLVLGYPVAYYIAQCRPFAQKMLYMLGNSPYIAP